MRSPASMVRAELTVLSRAALGGRIGPVESATIAGVEHLVFEADDLTGVATDLVGRITMQPNQFEVGMRLDAPDHLGAQIAGGDLEDPDSFGGGHDRSSRAERMSGLRGGA